MKLIGHSHGKNKNVTPEKITNTNMILKQYPRAKDLSLILCHCCGLLNSSKVNKAEAHKTKFSAVLDAIAFARA